MKSMHDFISRKAAVENSGDNYGVEAVANSGTIIVNQGLDYNSTKALCIDIVRDALDKYDGEAYKKAEQRFKELFDMFAAELFKRGMTDAQALAEFGEPAMQFDFAEAQKAYIKAGAPELAAVLSNILADRIGESSRSLLQIALGEAIQVAPKLLETQMATLALTFTLEHTLDLNVNNHKTFVDYIQNTVLPIYRKGVSRNQSEFQHLSFTGCSQYLASSKKLSLLFLHAYSGLFMRGFEDCLSGETDLVDAYPKLFTKCLKNDRLLQINAVSGEVLTNLIETLNMEQEHQKKIKKLFSENRMDQEAVQELVVNLVPEMQEVFDYWNNSEARFLYLSSVGIVIGAEYAKLITRENYDLSIWI